MPSCKAWSKTCSKSSDLVKSLNNSVVETHVAGVVDESGRVALHGGVDHGVVIDLEHVAADAARLVQLLALVRQDGADLLTRVLDHHLTGLEKDPTQHEGNEVKRS